MKFSVIIPTFNAGKEWKSFCSALLQNVHAEDVLIIDSGSTDGTVHLARELGLKVWQIPSHEFNHGGTRQLGVELCPSSDVLVFLTQDAILSKADDVVELIRSFDDQTVAAAFGRQLPRRGALPIEAHARLFNYSQTSDKRGLEDKDRLGFKSIFISNSFSAYRRSALESVGGFPGDVIFGEDTVTAAKLLSKGWKIAYVAEAQVYHSHSYTWRQEFRRYFDIGVLHSREQWLLKEFGGTGGEGLRFVRSEFHYLWPRYWWYVPSAAIRTALKFAGYKLGKMEARLPNGIKQRLSMNRRYWSTG